jgi:hypothetical protein
MELPTFAEQLVEADRLCTEARRLVGELRELAKDARERWQAIKLHNETRWGIAGSTVQARPKHRRPRPHS